LDPFDLSRRNSLKYLGFLAASVAGREFLTSWLSLGNVLADGPEHLVVIQGMDHHVAEPENTAPYTPQFFKPEDFPPLIF